MTRVLSTEQMMARLKTMGVFKKFKPYYPDGFETQDENPATTPFELMTRKLVFKDGVMSGSQICTWGTDSFNVWTSRKALANKLAKEHGLKVRLLDGEAELIVPAAKADLLLHKLGAKLKSTHQGPTLTPEQRARCAAGLAKWRSERKASKQQ